jgi:hypothetical protein
MENLKQQWQQFKDDKPGSRCQHLYERQHQEGQGKGKGFVMMGAGILLAILGLVLIPAPGPGFLVACLGLGLIGSQFEPLARFLDRSEVWARGVADRAKGAWRQISPGARAVMVTALAGLILGAGYGTYQYFF